MKKIELDSSIEDMDVDDLRTTFSEVMEAHAENVAEGDELQSEIDQYAAQVEELTGAVEGVKTYFAEKASETTSLEVDLLVDRFSLDELQDMAAEADAVFAEGTEPTAGGDDDDEPEGQKFNEKPPKAPVEDDVPAYRAEVEARLGRIPGLGLRD